MSPAVHTKHYTDPTRGTAARGHLRWLTSPPSGVRLPHLHPGDGTTLIFEYVAGPNAAPTDLPAVATTLGRLHAAAYAHELRHARLEQPFRTATGLVIPASIPKQSPSFERFG
ncbi:hypothetical protein [Phytohabitans aurantiacus]|uniref:Aminoglycoside phosphotransferase domain-containing protein n=1 Tax=Phytohabitans aurantiacus TaxID=3016789 RepID=A0ABQ5QX79_9ACTN|nr:hypothetical protein [Phytohabitans aurantiacus]GLH98867.1 hypothetical protein Pa4123_41420 [Phytohabitans aurantiacus]